LQITQKTANVLVELSSVKLETVVDGITERLLKVVLVDFEVDCTLSGRIQRGYTNTDVRYFRKMPWTTTGQIEIRNGNHQGQFLNPQLTRVGNCHS
jgi:hypothetical protein